MKEPSAPIEFPDDIGPGARLRRAREAANRSIGEISAALHLDPKTVEALEADSFDRLPAPTFVRGYMRGYARELGLPPGPILEVYDHQGFKPPALTPDITETPQTHASDLIVRLVTYAVGAVLVLLVVLWWHSQEFEGFDIGDIGGDLIGWSSESTSEPSLPAPEAPMPVAAPEGGEGGDESTATAGEPPEPSPDAGFTGDSEPPLPPSAEGTESGSIVVAAESPSGAVAGAPGATSNRAAPATPVPLPAGTASTEPSPGEDAGASGTTADPEAPARPAPRSEAAAAGSSDIVRQDAPAPNGIGRMDPAGEPDNAVLPATSPPAIPETTPSQLPPDVLGDTTAPPSVSGTAHSELVLDFTHESWVEIYDRDRARLFFGLVQPGRVLNLAGTPPFDILIGYARDVRVTLDGSPFDHAPYVRHGVARFSLGAPPGATPASRPPDGADSPALVSP